MLAPAAPMPPCCLAASSWSPSIDNIYKAEASGSPFAMGHTICLAPMETSVGLRARCRSAAASARKAAPCGQTSRLLASDYASGVSWPLGHFLLLMDLLYLLEFRGIKTSNHAFIFYFFI